MKFRLGVLAAVFCLAAAPAFAQGFAVKAGVNFGNFSIEESGEDDDPSTSMKTGFAAGGAFEVPLSPVFSVQPEVLYVQKGFTNDVSGFGKFELGVNFVDVPVLLKANFSGGTTRPFVTVGPVFGFRTGDPTVKVDGVEVDDEDDEEEAETFAMAIAVGGGVEFGKLIVEVRYNFGLTDLDPGNDSAKPRDLLLLFGFRF